MSVRVSVLVPGLEGPAAGGGAGATEAARALLSDLTVPGFTDLMRHASVTRVSNTGDTLPQMGAHLLGFRSDDESVFPAAALSRAAFPPCDSHSPSRTWLRADPVHLRADMGKLVVFPADVLSLSLDQSSRMLQWLVAQDLFPGPDLELLTATCWVCAPPEPADMLTVSPQAAYGANATQSIAQGGNAAQWHARMNEIQMLLHRCPVNEERERDGLAPINSLWYWGEGQLPAAPLPAAGFDSVHSDDPVVIGAASIAGLAAKPVSGSGDGWCQDLAAGDHLLTLGTLELAARAQDLDAWRSVFSDLDACWFAPLAEALKSARLSAVDLHFATGVARARRGRIWQRLRRGPDAAQSLSRLRQDVAS
jgi:hypothetical protein